MVTPEALTHLANQLRLGRLSLFVGAGLSIGAGLPSWEKLFAPLQDSLPDVESPSGWAGSVRNELPLLAEAYETEYGRNSLILHLRLALSRNAVLPTSVHEALSSLPVDTIATTNYDALIERA
ncbi:hypothetical protein [[Actinomadura] parvosata]|nr:hypothetical protein [Nonomuraea sp. ATCC 55076]